MNKKKVKIVNLSEEFIEKYKKLEDVIENKYKLKKGTSAVAFLEAKSEFSSISDKLKYCREVRNFLQHEPKINNSFAVTPSKEMIELIDYIIDYIENPLRCSRVAIRMKDMYYCKMEDTVLDSIINMDHLKYSHIPIIENGVLEGVFSKTSLFNYMISKRKFSLEKDLKFIDIKEFISPFGNNSECYKFARYDEKLDKVKDIFEENYHKAIRVAIVFLTVSGSRSDKVLGMITPYDVIK